MQPRMIIAPAQNQLVELLHPFAEQRVLQFRCAVFGFEYEAKRMLRRFLGPPVPAALNTPAGLNPKTAAVIRGKKLRPDRPFPSLAALLRMSVKPVFGSEQIPRLQR